MIFKLKADAEFEVEGAEGIDDAFGELAAHFEALCIDEPSPLQIVGGSIEIHPLEKEAKDAA